MQCSFFWRGVLASLPHFHYVFRHILRGGSSISSGRIQVVLLPPLRTFVLSFSTWQLTRRLRSDPRLFGWSMGHSGDPRPQERLMMISDISGPLYSIWSPYVLLTGWTLRMRLSGSFRRGVLRSHLPTPFPTRGVVTHFHRCGRSDVLLNVRLLSAWPHSMDFSQRIDSPREDGLRMTLAFSTTWSQNRRHICSSLALMSKL